MTAGNIDLASIQAITPQLGLFLLGVVVFTLDLLWKGQARRRLALITAVGLVLTGVASAIWGIPSTVGNLVFGGMLRHDWLAYTFTMVFLFGGTITALLSRNDKVSGQRGEFYLLLIISILGMSLMAGSADLIMLFLAIETTSIPLYVLAGFQRKDHASVEAGFKYLLYGSLTSALMLYGFSLLYGFTGTTQMAGILDRLGQGSLPGITTAGVMILILIGIGFKISAVPFHFWAPDVYQGASSQVSGFLSTASKAAGFSVLLRLFLSALLPNSSVWFMLVAVLSVASMTFGNLQAINQKNIKRLLAYSSIAQAGYVLVGVAAISNLGVSAVTFYLMAYLVTNLAAFGIVTIIGRTIGSDDISAYAGLSRRSPGLALGLLAAFLSLAGIPPFAGFVGKVLLFTAAMQSQLAWLVIIGILNSIIGLYYYLVVLKVAYLDRSEGDEQPLQLDDTARVAVLLCVTGVVLVGILFAPLYELARAVAAGIL